MEQGIYPLIARANVQDFFSELKESEDERIRNKLIEAVTSIKKGESPWFVSDKETCDKVLDWLERQGEPNPYSGVSFKYNGHTWCMCARDNGVEILVDGEIKERVFLGEKPQGKSALEAIREEKVDKANKIEPNDYSSIDPHFGKPIDKIEPKLKIEKDKWYVCIRDLDDNYGTKAFSKGSIYYSTKDETLIPDNSNIPSEIKYCVNHYFRLWTIEDAKDGDVLANKNGAIFINAGSSGGGTLDCYCYLSVQNEFCIEKHKTGSWLYKDDIKPATKEQCNLLFQRMKEAGCKWDAEKKELMKEEVK